MSEPHRIGGRYELGELLGRGGMAEVRKGTDVRLGRTVAVKRLRTDLASDATFQARFRREAQSAASLNNTRIVSVYDTGEETATDGSGVAQPYIVMEYVAGRTLRDILREGRKILPERALEITSQVLEALDYSHRAGIIHRDIKPGNVMLTPTGDVKVMDFGIARAVSDASSTMTQTAAVVGTAQYLSPEQARGENVDSRSDVYSTGCLLYELLTGRPPFVGDSPVAVAYQHVREQAPPPSSLDEDLTPEIDAIVMKSLAKNVGDRYPSAAAMRADIDRYLAGQPVQAPPVPATPALPFEPTDAPTTVTTVSQQVEEEPPRRRRRGPLALLILLLVALIVAALVFGPRLFESRNQQVAVPTVTGLTRAEAEARIQNAGLDVGTVSEASSKDVAAGRVISQDPSDTSEAERGSEVDLVVSNGKPQVRLPDVVGQPKGTAAQQLQASGLRVVLTQRDTDDPKDQVVEMQPPAGTQVADGSKVTLFWSDGPEEVPAVRGKTEAEATRLIEAAGFQVSKVTDTATPSTKGTVLQQSPKAGTTLDKGSTVTIVVSDYTAPSPTPTPTPPTPTPTVPTPSP
ncbi:MAG: Stk1 family PASTA domain-containing Ser/Thr kinase [Marmoricola sp.]|nr:Stk1 family PASTA domain-containing Ser/Thr kinase [Marmoricola sp.]